MNITLKEFSWKRNLYVLWFLQAITPMGFTFTFAFFPLFFQQLGVEEPSKAALWNGVSGWVFGAAMAVFGPFWGIVGDRFGRKRNLIRATLLAGLILTPAGLVQTPGQLVLIRFLTGALAGVSSTIMALVGAGTPRSKLGFALGFMQSALFLGTTIGPLVGGMIFDSYGMKMAFVATGSTLLLAAFLGLMLVQDRTDPTRNIRQITGKGGHPIPELWRLATSRRMLPVLTIIFLGNLSQMIVLPVVPLIVASMDYSANVATASGVILTCVGAASVISSVGTGQLTTKYDIKKIFISWCLIGGLLYLAPYFFHGYWQMAFALTLVGLFQGGIAGSANALMAFASPPNLYGSSFGAAQSAVAMALAFGPLIGGFASVALGLDSVYIIGSATFIITAFVGIKFLKIRE